MPTNGVRRRRSRMTTEPSASADLADAYSLFTASTRCRSSECIARLQLSHPRDRMSPQGVSATETTHPGSNLTSPLGRRTADESAGDTAHVGRSGITAGPVIPHVFEALARLSRMCAIVGTETSTRRSSCRWC